MANQEGTATYNNIMIPPSSSAPTETTQMQVFYWIPIRIFAWFLGWYVCGFVSLGRYIFALEPQMSENLAQTLRDLKGDTTDKQLRELVAEIQTVYDLVKKTQTKTDKTRQKIGLTRHNLRTLESEKRSVTSQCNNAVKALDPGHRLNETTMEMDAASKSLQVQSEKAEKIAAKLKQKGSEFSTKATKIIGALVEGIKTLAGIQAGAYEQVKLLKGEFRRQLDDLMSVVKDSNNLAEAFEQCQDNIDGAFKSLQRGRSDWNDFKREITNHIRTINRLLEGLAMDER
eukprot:530698_1